MFTTVESFPSRAKMGDCRSSPDHHPRDRRRQQCLQIISAHERPAIDNHSAQFLNGKKMPVDILRAIGQRHDHAAHSAAPPAAAARFSQTINLGTEFTIGPGFVGVDQRGGVGEAARLIGPSMRPNVVEG